MEAVREGIGEECDIIIEWNSLTSTSGALQLADYFSDLNILFMEEPTHYNSPEAQIKVSVSHPFLLQQGSDYIPDGDSCRIYNKVPST